MRLICYECSKSVSTEVPPDTVVRATLICPECLELADQQALEVVLRSITHGREQIQRQSRMQES